MNRLDRLTAILIHLQSKRVIRAQEIADRFEISLRTVYRDIRSLEEAGVPIGAEAGVGYFLENYHLPPVMFTNAEASALVFGAKLMEKMADASLQEPFTSALFKIKSVLKHSEKEHLTDLEPAIDVSIRPRPTPFSDTLLNRIQAAIVQQLVLTINYLSGYTDEITQRDVEPIGLWHYGVGWHLIGFCRLRQDYRDFRVDRIRQLSQANQTFSRQSRQSLQDYLDQLRQTENLQEAVVWFDKNMARFAQQDRYGFGFVSETEQNDRVQMRFLTQTLLGLGAWLLMFGKGITIESPDSLRELMKTRATEIYEHYAV
jgi:predicted DNA-binding transcriptional regulator YafY